MGDNNNNSIQPSNKDEFIRQSLKYLGRDAEFLRKHYTDIYLRFQKFDSSGRYSNDDLKEVIEFFTGYPGHRATIGDFSKDPVRAEAFLALDFAHVTATKILEKEAVKREMDLYSFHKRAELTREICNREPRPVIIDVKELSKEDQLIFQKNDADIVRIKAHINLATQNQPPEIDFTELDAIDQKIIELYQEAEKQAVNNPKVKIKLPGSRKIAKALFKSKIVDKQFSHTAIDKRIKKLRDKGLIGHPDDNKDKPKRVTSEHIDDMGGQIKQTF